MRDNSRFEELPLTRTAYYGEFDGLGYAVHSSWPEGVGEPQAADKEAEVNPVAERGPDGQLRVSNLRAPLNNWLTLPEGTENPSLTLRFARDLAAAQRSDHPLVPSGFLLMCQLRIFDRARGKDGYADGSFLIKEDFRDVDLSALAHAVGGEAFGREVARIQDCL